MKIGIVDRHQNKLGKADIETLKEGRIEAIKLHRLCDELDYDKYLVVYEVPLTGIASPQDYYNTIIGRVTKAYDVGVRHLILHHYPNCKEYGYGIGWFTADGFYQWWRTVFSLLKNKFPDLLIGMPAMQPGCSIGTIRTDAETFFDGCADIINLADFIEVHCWWKTERDISKELERIVSYCNRASHKQVIVEFSCQNSTVGKETKGKQYLDFYRSLGYNKNVMAAFAFLVSSPEIEHKYFTWRTEKDKQSVITQIIGERNF